ncbi:MAG: TIM barrel protein [Alphaproteobacteria bacterium]|nr:TIM barrel protein [Alphaproteobacteria bacterium]
MRKFGLKLWSMDFIKNKDFVLSAEKALKDGKFGYLELFALPDTFDLVEKEIRIFKGIKTVIHAPHDKYGFNTSDRNLFADNQHMLYDSQRFADLLKAKIIITHPGYRSNVNVLEENIRQFRAFNEPRLAVENLPYTCSSMHKDLEGATPDEIKCFIDEVPCQFCFDFSHAVCSANHFKQDVYEFLAKFAKLKPCMYHLCDGDITSTFDAHLHYGEGNYNLKRFVSEFTSKNALITMETGFGLPSSVQPWLDDLAYIQSLCE